MIQGIFYARFFPQEGYMLFGTKIVAQSPPGCIVPVPGVSKPPLFDFSVLSEYVIPRQAFCNRYITVNDPEGKYSVLGFPVSIRSQRYDRNEFIFNFGIVVECEAVTVADQIPYERVVRRLAVTFAEMEKQNCYLSQDPARYHVGGSGGKNAEYSQYHQKMQQQVLLQQQQLVAGGGGGGGGGNIYRRPIESLLEIVKEDLNNYGECMIPVDDANTINMKLFPHHPTPPEVKGWHVPVAKMKFSEVVDPTWDLTLQRVIAHIDGVSDVRRIAFAADVSLELTQLALRHLLYYDTILLLDMFFFGACYAPRPAVADFVTNLGGIVDECANYVCIVGSTTHHSPSSPTSHHLSSSSDKLPSTIGSESLGDVLTSPGGSSLSNGGSGGGSHRISNYMLIKLMTTFCVGKTVAEWLKGHVDAGFDVMRFVDVRRLVQFGLIKGLLYRVHKYIVSKQYLAALATGQARPLGAGGDSLQRYTDGRHTFDQIMTEQNLTDGEIMDRLKSFPAPAGDLTVLYK
ncbi:nitrogen permease regulator 2 [Apodospora peruviana]|uniref:Nitrogen permease regulator 2 n=1 Tax=Apodospora peruviana TaxID=516989 RepID=A0AAE0IS38_9PEZI|nr:nitrogen permease regulator 2 [Apodospora peruviana]